MTKCTGQGMLMSCHLMIGIPIVCRLGIHVYTQYVCICLC